MIWWCCKHHRHIKVYTTVLLISLTLLMSYLNGRWSSPSCINIYTGQCRVSPCLTLSFALKLSSNLSNCASPVVDGYCTFPWHGHSTLLSSCGSSRLAAVTVRCHCAHLPPQSPPLQRRSQPCSCSGQICSHSSDPHSCVVQAHAKR